MKFNTLEDIDVKDKKVLLRLDLNVPFKDGVVSDSTRIDRIVPTVKNLLARDAIVIILTHIGRPKGVADPELSVGVLVRPLIAAFGHSLTFIPTNWADDRPEQGVAEASKGELLLLDNIRYHPGEETNDPEFVERLAALGDIYVNDAFSVSHRAHASTAGLAEKLPSAAGLSMQEELEALAQALESPVHPVVAVVGGAKVSTKLELLGNLTKKVDQLIIGGGMANTFLASQGVKVGASLCEHDLLDTAKSVMDAAKTNNCEILLPSDVTTAKEFKAGAEKQIKDLNSVADDDMILDVGDQTITDLCAILKTAKTLVWNGPMGAFEISPFDNGTSILAQEAASLTKDGKLVSIAGGGDTVAALNHAGVGDQFSYVSTAGGAFLEWLEGKELPGVKALLH